jgi:HNH endonuclease
MPCIFCGIEENLTEEHLFPAFTGANLTVPNASCRKCNAQCGKFEDVIARLTETARHIFEIPNRYGRIPTATLNVEIEGEALRVPGRRKADGEIEVFDFVAKTTTEDGKSIREGFFVSDELAKRFVERSLARGEKVTEREMPKEVVLLPSSQQTLEFAFSLEMRKMVTKIALVSLAYQYGIEYALLSQFDALRSAPFASSASDLTTRIFANEDFVSDYIKTPRQHSVRAYLSAGMNKGWALVGLFGGLSYAIELTRAFRERNSLSFSLFYDTETQTRFNPVVLYDEQEIIGRVLSLATVFEKQEAVDAQWYPIVERYCQDNGLELSRITPQSS